MPVRASTAAGPVTLDRSNDSRVRGYARQRKRVETALVDLDFAWEQFAKNWHRIEHDGHASARIFVRYLEEGLVRIQKWAGGENVALLKAFRADKSAAFLDEGIDTLAGMAAGPLGEVAGYVVGVGISQYRNYQTDRQVEASVRASQFATDAGVKGTQSLMALINEEGSLLHRLGQYSGAAHNMFGAHYNELYDDLWDYRTQLSKNEYVGSSNVVRRTSAARQFKERYVDLEVEFHAATREFGRITNATWNQIAAAIERVKLTFVNSVSAGAIAFSGQADVVKGSLRLKASLSKLGEFESSQVGSETIEYLIGHTPKELAQKAISPGRTSSFLIMPITMKWRRPGFWAGTGETRPLFLWKNGQFLYEPDRFDDEALKLLGGGQSNSSMTAVNLGQKLEAINLKSLGRGVDITM
jgi:hypothetical protein